MAKFQLDADETILKEGVALHLKSVIKAQRGRLYLTNKRLLFLRATNAIQQLVGTDVVVCNVPLQHIQEMSQSTHGRNDNVLNVQTDDHTVYRFLVDSYQNWFNTYLQHYAR